MILMSFLGWMATVDASTTSYLSMKNSKELRSMNNHYSAVNANWDSYPRSIIHLLLYEFTRWMHVLLDLYDSISSNSSLAPSKAALTDEYANQYSHLKSAKQPFHSSQTSVLVKISYSFICQIGSHYANQLIHSSSLLLVVSSYLLVLLLEICFHLYCNCFD